MAIPASYCWGQTGKVPAAKLRPITIIPSKEFIAAIAGERDRHMLSSHSANVVRGHSRGISEGLFHDTGYVVNRALDVRLDDQFMMLSVKLPRNRASMVRFIEVLARKSNRKCLHAL